MDHGFTRAQEPWEASDGCVFLLRELASVKGDAQDKAASLVVKHMESLADLGFIDHFKHANSLKENLFKTLA